MKYFLFNMNQIDQLIPQTYFGKTLTDYSDADYRRIRDNYDAFVSQLLSDRYEVNGVSAHPLNRFVPCDLEGNVLEKPKNYKSNFEEEFNSVNRNETCKPWYDKCLTYQQAKEGVLFEGFENRIVNKENAVYLEGYAPLLLSELTQENLEYITKWNITLTPTAKTMIYGNS